MHCLEDTQGSAQSLYSSNFYNKIKVYIWIFFFFSSLIPSHGSSAEKKKSPSFQKKKAFFQKKFRSSPPTNCSHALGVKGEKNPHILHTFV